MKLIFYVVLPTCIQLIIGAVIMFSHKPGGEFVGLGVMLLGLIAIPATAIINYSRIRIQPPIQTVSLINRTFYTTAIFPVLSLSLYLLAS